MHRFLLVLVEIEDHAKCNDNQGEDEGTPYRSYHYYKTANVWHRDHISKTNRCHGDHCAVQTGIELFKILIAYGSVVHNFKDSQYVGHYQNWGCKNVRNCELGISGDENFEGKSYVGRKPIILIPAKYKCEV
jgi:hypothetical protein